MLYLCSILALHDCSFHDCFLPLFVPFADVLVLSQRALCTTELGLGVRRWRMRTVEKGSRGIQEGGSFTYVEMVCSYIVAV